MTPLGCRDVCERCGLPVDATPAYSDYDGKTGHVPLGCINALKAELARPSSPSAREVREACEFCSGRGKVYSAGNEYLDCASCGGKGKGKADGR